MRPVCRGSSPQSTDFDPYELAKPELVSRIGMYCSFCERYIATNLAVEHIQPKKGAFGQPNLIGRWDNFLLECVNCNSTKGDKQVIPADLLLPDRDNTFVAFDYTADGKVAVSKSLLLPVATLASATLRLVGLDKQGGPSTTSNGTAVALDRVSQRMEAWGTALESERSVSAQPTNSALRDAAVQVAKATGFFSIWMTVFANDSVMCGRFIDAFAGTRASGCFDPTSNQPVSPAPNPVALPDGGKA